MATYKVIQDIEAEDKLLGPLTLRQFIYAAITGVLGFLTFRFFAGGQLWYFSLLTVFPMIFFGLLAAPIGHDQSSEVWMLAKVRFFLKPKIRIWDKSGVSQLVTITVPKVVQKFYSDGLSQSEVRSRLQALATTIDSRGWAVKDMLYQPPPPSDRLVAPEQAQVGNPPPPIDMTTIVDVMDEQTNPTAVHFEQMIAESEALHRQQIEAELAAASKIQPGSQPDTKSTTKKDQSVAKTAAPDFWFLHQGPKATKANEMTFSAPQVIAPGSINTDILPPVSGLEEQALLERIHSEKAKPLPGIFQMHNKRALNQLPDNKPTYTLPKINLPSTVASPKVQNRSTVPANAPDNPLTPAIMNLANNNDLNLETLSREAERARVQTLDSEVVISFNHGSSPPKEDSKN